ncbi:MAG: hypothetical protein Q9M94_02665 [Candidatus Gracilibacteria bacterium]|nr:hypothetical protein [Candidatus Gracilibacteria bacterium]
MRNRNNNNIKNIKDYIVPIVTFLLIFILIYIAFSGGDDKEQTSNPSEGIINNTGIDITFGGDDTEVEKIGIKNKKTKLQNLDKINIGESIIVKSGDVSFNIPDIAQFNLNTNGKINYISNNNIELESNALWVNTLNKEKISTRYTEVNLGANTIANIEQNEISSTVYLLKGVAEVKTLAGVSTFLSPGKKIVISNQDTSKEDLDLNLLKTDFDDYFKIGDWYLKNNGSISLQEFNISNSGSTTGTGEIETEKKNFNIIGLLNFDNIYDEGFVNSPSTNISGKFADERISKILINGKQTIVNIENKTFNLIGVNTEKKENDIVIKIFDNENNILGKYIYTVYYSESSKNNNLENGFAKVNAEPYPVNGSDFIILIPTVKEGETFSSENTFYGTVKNPDVASVTINGYKLKTFNGKIFRYHAYERFKTLGEGVNNYEIKYYDINGKVILKKYVTINKKSVKAKKIEETDKISKEANIN